MPENPSVRVTIELIAPTGHVTETHVCREAVGNDDWDWAIGFALARTIRAACDEVGQPSVEGVMAHALHHLTDYAANHAAAGSFLRDAVRGANTEIGAAT